MSYHSRQVHERHDSASAIWYWYRNDSPTTDDVDLSREEGKTKGRFKEVSADKKQINDRCTRGLNESMCCKKTFSSFLIATFFLT